MKGYGQQQDNTPLKWTHINQIMRDKKIAILAVQETHMDEERRESIGSIFGRRLHITASADKDSPSQRAGIAIVFNKSFVNTSSEKTQVIHEGRAILSSIEWGGKKTLTILAVYAPNTASENTAFWQEIRQFFADHPRVRKPDIMLGDFNMVEDAIDRNPSHNDGGPQTQELAGLKADLHLRDGWRHLNPDSRAFTFSQPLSNGGARSRIDRIYVTDQLLERSSDWETNHSGLANTDHKLVSARVTNAAAPQQGKGRWSLPERVIVDKAFRERVKNLTKLAWEEICTMKNGPRTELNNAQKIYMDYKSKLRDEARRRDKIMTPKILRDIEALKKDLLATEGSQDESQDLTSRLIEEKIAVLEKRRHNKIRDLGKVRNRLEGETNSRYWMQTNKDLKPRDVIFALKDPNLPDGATKTSSKKMAELAMRYHNDLQSNGRERDEIERELVIRRESKPKQTSNTTARWRKQSAQQR
ncbi:hypothetical protein PLEOSDRAFT_154311 [Pleurotus ostreatus PC15]|uniref:Endonuclease/exonuclease/phosphatase domain-containing protein n=1 Tax=Pleurotus ostreatus (strain PC15) TaxID=1137138 RepID=A0A067P867_PLEO1|nr:hypothetical protein PLEOSDRAFT_154311 [Pleurotus ostreatus PC15]